jgi:hypothetical protein
MGWQGLATGAQTGRGEFALASGREWVGRVSDRTGQDRGGRSSWDMSRLSWKVWQRLRACVGVAPSRGRGVFGNGIARSRNHKRWRLCRGCGGDGAVGRRQEMKKVGLLESSVRSGLAASSGVQCADRRRRYAVCEAV